MSTVTVVDLDSSNLIGTRPSRGASTSHLCVKSGGEFFLRFHQSLRLYQTRTDTCASTASVCNFSENLKNIHREHVQSVKTAKIV